MLIFRSEEQIDRWRAARDLPRGAVLSPQIAWELARAWYQDKVHPHWRRHTVEEAEALFMSLGLKEAFWQLR
jgi:carboxypeptidase C (cathepsin A)